MALHFLARAFVPAARRIRAPKTLAASLAIAFAAGGGVGCANLFLQPNRVRYPFVNADGLAIEEFSFPSLDGARLQAMYLPAIENQRRRPDLVRAKADRPRALVVQFHGNAENMTSHFRLVLWLPFYGVDLLAFDYRGYGASEGFPHLRGANLDARAALRLADRMAQERGLPLIAFGQSLGGALLLRALEDEPPPPSLRMVAIESSFGNYREIAREKMQGSWLTWPLQWLAYPLVSDRWSPLKEEGGRRRAERLPKVPYVLVYSAIDPIVPIRHGVELFAALPEPKEFWEHPEPGHVNGMFVQGGALRARFLAAMDKAIAKGVKPAK